MADTKITLGYWGVAGLAQPSRFLLAVLGANWEDKVYTAREQWFDQDKTALGFKFPNLPYLLDGETKITESIAILKYIAKRFGREDLLGKSPADYGLVETYFGVIKDIEVIFGPLVYNEDWKNQLAPTWDKVKDKIHLIESNIVNETALGYLTVVDFKLAATAMVLFKVYKDKEGEFKKLTALRDHVYGLPEVKKYLEKGVSLLISPFAKLQLE